MAKTNISNSSITHSNGLLLSLDLSVTNASPPVFSIRNAHRGKTNRNNRRHFFMRKLALSSLALAFIFFILGPSVIFAQNEVTGTWSTKNTAPKPPKPPKPPKTHNSSADDEDEDEPDDDKSWDDKSVRNDPNKIYLSFERKTENGRNQFGARHSFSDIDGLTRSQVDNGGPVSFRIVREAGTIEAQGNFANGAGSGTFRFVPNMRFVSDMKSRGFDFEKPRDDGNRKRTDTLEERLFSAATIGVTVAHADDLRSANFGDLDVDDLYKAVIFKIDGKFIAEMKSTGFPNLDMEDLVKARIFKIDADYVRQVKDMGFEDQGFEGLVKFRIFKVTPHFLGQMRSVGFDKLDAEDIVKCRIFKIDADFVRQARASEPNATIEDMVQMKIGVRRRK